YLSTITSRSALCLTCVWVVDACWSLLCVFPTIVLCSYFVLLILYLVLLVFYCCSYYFFFFFFSSRRRHTRFSRDWSSDVCSSDLAIVDEDLVLESELNSRTASVLERLQAQYSQLPPKEVLEKQILEQLILERIQLQLAKRYDINPSAEEVNQAIVRIAQRNQMTAEQLAADLQRQNLSLDELREQIRTELTISQLQQGVVNSRIRVTEQEIDNFLQSTDGKFATSPDFHLGHILIAVSSSADPAMVSAAEKEAQEIYEKLQKGADFAQLAISHSNDQSALQGGDIGWRKLAQLPELFAKQLESLGTGEVTKPFRSGAGFHILKNIEQRGGGAQLVEQTKARH